METEDRLLAQIDQMGKVLAKVMADVFNLKSQPDFNPVKPAIWQALKDEAGLDLDQMLTKPSTDVLDYLTVEKQLSEPNLNHMGDLFYELGRGDEENWEQHTHAELINLQHAYAIWEYLNKTSKMYSLDRQYKIERMREKFKSLI